MADRGGIECVVFDVGGIIVRHARDWREAHVLAGFDPAHSVLSSEEFMAARVEFGQRHQRGELAPDEYWQALAAASNGAYTRDDVESILGAWLFEEYAGAPELIDDLLATGIETASLSNTNASHWAQVMHDGHGGFPTTRRLRHHAPSHEVGAVKPEPAIYEALEALTGLEGASLLFFDDRDDNVEAARSRGWRAEVIDHAGDPPAQMRALLRRYGVLG